MTGFGRSDFAVKGGRSRVEIRSTNQKYFELSARIPNDLAPFNEKIRRMVNRLVKRGKVYLMITSPEALLTEGHVQLNESAAREYAKALRKLKAVIKSKENISLTQLASLPDVMRRTIRPEDVERSWDKARMGIDKALKAFDRSRMREGSTLRLDMSMRSDRIAREIRNIQKRVPKVISGFRNRSRKRLRGSGEPAGLKDKLVQEVAAFAKNSDITEEVIRLLSHIRAFKATLDRGGEVGRKIDFICQEMVREANTIGAKSNDFMISDRVVEVKSELEKIREQAQNIE